MSKFDWFLWISHSTLFTVCADQLLYSLSLIKWCSARGKQNTAVKTVIDAYFIVSKIDIPNVVGEPASSLIINFEQVMDFYIFHFFLISGWFHFLGEYY